MGSDGTTFYVLTGWPGSASVTVLNSQTGKVAGTVPVPADTVSVVPDIPQTPLYVLERTGLVSQVSIASGQIIEHVLVGKDGESPALSPDGSTLYVLKGTSQLSNIAVVDTGTQSVRRVLPAPSALPPGARLGQREPAVRGRRDARLWQHPGLPGLARPRRADEDGQEGRHRSPGGPRRAVPGTARHPGREHGPGERPRAARRRSRLAPPRPGGDGPAPAAGHPAAVRSTDRLAAGTGHDAAGPGGRRGGELGRAVRCARWPAPRSWPGLSGCPVT